MRVCEREAVCMRVCARVCVSVRVCAKVRQCWLRESYKDLHMHEGIYSFVSSLCSNSEVYPVTVEAIVLSICHVPIPLPPDDQVYLLYSYLHGPWLTFLCNWFHYEATSLGHWIKS